MDVTDGAVLIWLASSSTRKGTNTSTDAGAYDEDCMEDKSSQTRYQRQLCFPTEDCEERVALPKIFRIHVEGKLPASIPKEGDNLIAINQQYLHSIMKNDRVGLEHKVLDMIGQCKKAREHRHSEHRIDPLTLLWTRYESKLYLNP